MKFIPLSVVIFSLSIALQAQQPTPVPSPTCPPGPLLKPAPDFTKWTVTSKSPGSDAKKNEGKTDSVNLCTGAKTGDIIHIVNVMGNGGREEIWSNGKVMVVTNARWKTPMVAAGKPEEFTAPTWISSRNFVDIKKDGDKQYIIFRDKIFPGGKTITQDMVGEGVDPESLKVDATASIDEATRLPVGVQVGGEITTYKFEALTPGVMQTLPANVEAALSDQRQVEQATTRKSVRP